LIASALGSGLSSFLAVGTSCFGASCFGASYFGGGASSFLMGTGASCFFISTGAGLGGSCFLTVSATTYCFGCSYLTGPGDLLSG